MKPINLLILLVLVAGAIYAAVYFSSQGGDGAKATKDDDATKDAPRLEERYGFTGETVDP